MDIDGTNVSVAIDLLERGFPRRSRQFWETGIARLIGSRNHWASSTPIGTMLCVKGEAVGIALSSSSFRSCPNSGDQARVINLCSWYIEPEHRWRMPVMLRRAMKFKDAVYTDLSPTPDVQPMLTALGFVPSNNGVEVVSVPAMALCRAGSIRVVSWRDADRTVISPEVAGMLDDHVAYGCYAFVMEVSGRHVPLIIKPFRRAGLPMAQIIYCGDGSVIQDALAAVCRALIVRGRVGLVVDIPVDQKSKSSLTRIALPSRRRRYIKNGLQNGAVDYAYSELVFFDL